MCGIAGIVAHLSACPPTRRSGIAMRDAMTHRGPDESGLFSDTRALLARPPSGHRGPRRGHSRCPTKTDDLDHLQRRNLQPRRAAHRARAERSSLPDQVRHRNHRPRLRRVGRAGGRALLRACSRSPSGTRRAAGCSSSATGLASSRCTGRARPTGPAVRIGNQVDSRQRADRGPARTSGCCRVLGTRYRRRRHAVPRDPKLLPGHLPSSSLKTAASGRDGIWDIPPSVRLRRRAGPIEFSSPAPGIGPPAPDERRPARVFLSGGHRLQRDRRDHGAARHGRSKRSRWRSRSRAFTSCASAARWSHGQIGAEHHEVVLAAAISSTRCRGSIWHEDEPIALPARACRSTSSPSSPATRHGGADRRGQRRAARRLRQYRDRAWNGGRARVYGAAAGFRAEAGRAAAACNARCRDAPGARGRPVSRDWITPESAVPRQLRRPCPIPRTSVADRDDGGDKLGAPPPTTDHARALHACERDVDAARPAALRGHQDTASSSC